MTYADAIRIISWQAWNQRVTVRVIEDYLSSGEFVPEMDTLVFQENIARSGVRVFDYYYNDSGHTEPNVMQLPLEVKRTPSALELNAAMQWLDDDSEQLYGLKAAAIHRLNPPITGAHLINHTYCIAYSLEHQYSPHLPATETQIGKIKAGIIPLLEYEDSFGPGYKYRTRVCKDNLIMAIEMIVSLINNDYYADIETEKCRKYTSEEGGTGTIRSGPIILPIEPVPGVQ